MIVASVRVCLCVYSYWISSVQ